MFERVGKAPIMSSGQRREEKKKKKARPFK